MSFYSFLKGFVGQDTPEGDFAGDVMRDTGFPKLTRSRKRVFYHLVARGACAEAINAFSRCWSCYTEATNKYKGLVADGDAVILPEQEPD